MPAAVPHPQHKRQSPACLIRVGSRADTNERFSNQRNKDRICARSYQQESECVPDIPAKSQNISFQ